LTEAEQVGLLLDLLRRGQSVELRLGGLCMRPWAFEGDRVRLEPLTERPRRGEVVMLRGERGLLAHRVLHAGPDRVLTRGDLSAAADPPWRYAEVLGRVVAIEHRVGLRVPLDGRLLPLLGWAAAPCLRGLQRAWRWLQRRR
jgi:hypothetical protein